MDKTREFEDVSKKTIHNAIANAVVKMKVADKFRGTGFFITPDGYVFTAYHCGSGAWLPAYKLPEHDQNQ